MHVPLQLAAQLASLDRQKQRLIRPPDIRSLIEQHLTTPLLEYEIGKMRGFQGLQGDEQDQAEVSRSEAEALLKAVIDLDKALERLDSADLVGLQGVLIPDQEHSYRQDAGQPATPSHQPVDSARIPGAMDRFFEWVRSPSFAEMHPVEQMSLAQMRLYEIDPFPHHSLLIVSLFSHYFLLQGEYLLPLYELREVPRFYQALEEAFQLSSEPLVRFNVQGCQRAYEHVLSQVG